MHSNIHLKKTYLIHLLLITFFILAFLPQSALCEDLKGGWVHYQRQAPQKDIRSIYTLPNGDILVDTETTYSDTVRTFHIFDRIKWQKITYKTDKLGKNPPFICDSEGHFYFVNNNKNLVVWDYAETGDSISECDSTELFTPIVGAFSGDDSLYIGSYSTTEHGGIYKFDGDTITKIRDGRTHSLAVDYSGQLWAIHKEPDSTTVGLWVLENGEWFDKTEDLKSISNDLTVQTAPDSSVWVNNLGYYGIYKDGEWTFHNGGEGPMLLSFDISGGVWGYNRPNLYRLNEDGNWNLCPIGETIQQNITNMSHFLTVTPDSTVWTTASQNIYRYSENQEELWIPVESSLDLASDVVTCLAYTDDGRLVCGHGIRDKNGMPIRGEDSLRAGVSILDGSSWYNYSEDKYTRFKNVYDLLQLSNGEILAYTDSGYKFFDGYTWENVDSMYVDDKHLSERYHVDMIEYGYEIVLIGTSHGIFLHDFLGFPEYLGNKPDPVVSFWNTSFDNLYVDDDRIIYMQNGEGSIISYNISAENTKWKKLFVDKNIRDFAVDDEEWIWAAKAYNIFRIQGEISEKVKISPNTDEEIELKNASLVHIDEEERIWASGYDNTGYIEDGIWHRIPELSGTASDEYASSEEGKIALNAIEVIDYNENQINYYGVFEYYPDEQSSVSEQKPNQFSVTSNYPNPFNSFTTISFELSYPEVVKISIYNISGQNITTLTNRKFPQGRNNVIWDSKSGSGVSVASGIYFYRIETKHVDQTGKMILLR